MKASTFYLFEDRAKTSPFPTIYLDDLLDSAKNAAN